MLYDKMEKLMDKKRKSEKELSDVEKQAKMDVLKDLKSQAADAMGEKLKGLKKVTVASDSKDGLEEGLDKAKEILEAQPEGQQEELEEGMEESQEHEQEEFPEMSEDEINAQLEKLMKLKEKIKK